MKKISIVIGYATEHGEIVPYLDTLKEMMEKEPEFEYEVILASDIEWSKPIIHPIVTKQMFMTVRGFSKVFNEAVRETTGDYIVISNCDQRMKTPWANRCVQALEETGAWMAHVQPNLAQLNYDALCDVVVRGLPAFFWVIPRDKWIGFDERYAKNGGYHDDHDYCEEIKKRGGHYIWMRGVGLWHTSRGHLQTNPNREGIRRENGKVFEEKWKKRSDT